MQDSKEHMKYMCIPFHTLIYSNCQNIGEVNVVCVNLIDSFAVLIVKEVLMSAEYSFMK